VFAAVLILASVLYVGGIFGIRWLQRRSDVEAPGGTRYRVQAGPSGVPQLAPVTNYNGTMLVAPILLLRFAIRRPRMWVVEVVEVKSLQILRSQPAISEEFFRSRSAAFHRLDELVSSISDGRLHPSGVA
jgi:hypothetical protein